MPSTTSGSTSARVPAPTALGVLANDDDPDGNDLTIKSVTAAAHGTVTITGNGTGLAYRPAKWFHGTDMFTYTVDDGHGATDNATVQVIVDKDVAGPVAVAPLQRFPGQTLGHQLGQGAGSPWSATDPGSGVTRYMLQVSVNGGAFKTVTLPRATTTSIDQTLAYGRTYRFRVRAFDHEGNAGAYAYGPTFRLGKYEESTAAVAYTTGWGTIRAHVGPRRSGALHRRRDRVGDPHTPARPTSRWRDAHVQQRARRRSTWTASWSRPSTSAASSTAYRQLIYARHFATLEAHTFEVRAVGDGRVELDAFEILR